jgi:putative tryptophan/tyrosine transport system substrate-binding protein
MPIACASTRPNWSRLCPDVILAVGGPSVGPLLQANRTTPIVFVQVTDPVGAGYVASLARPGGNVTGFAMFEFGISVKWLELLKEISPVVTRAVILRDPTIAAGIGLLGAMQAAAPALGMELSPVGVVEVAEIEHGITAFGRESNGGLVVLPGPYTALRRDLIIALAAQRRLPAVYPYRYYVAAAGLTACPIVSKTRSPAVMRQLKFCVSSARP